MNQIKKLDLPKIGLFLLIVYLMAIITSLVIYFTGGLENSPQVFSGIRLAVILLASTYMFAPALANILTRLMMHEGFGGTWLRPQFKRHWGFWILAWFAPGLLTVFGGAVYFLIFPQYFDISMPVIRKILEQRGTSALAVPVLTIAASQFFSAILISPLINGLFTFGEEFGWRAYLLQKLMPLGFRKAVLVLGIIWGTWHWPIIILGYNYGFNYFGAPFLGPLVFVWFTFCLGTFLAWMVLKAGSVWPAVIAHAAVNGIAAFAALFQTGQPDVILGPTVQGIIGSLGFALLGVILFIKPGNLKFGEPVEIPVKPLVAENS